MNLKVSLEHAELNDIPALALIITDAYTPIKNTLSRLPGILVNTENMLNRRIAEKRVYKVVLPPTKCIGTYDLNIDENNNCHFSHFAIFPDYQHQGLGKYILGEVIKQLKEQNVSSITLEIYEKTPHLYRFYESLDFNLHNKKEIKDEKIFILKLLL